MDANKMEQTKRGTIEEINYLRAFGVLAVIAIHTTGYFTEVNDLNLLVILNLWTDVFSQFAVPLFILISGFLLAKKYRGNFSISRFYSKRIRSIIPQFLIFSVLYTAFNNWATMKNSPLSANLTLIFNHIWQSDASYHLWFFAIIIQLYIFYPIIIKVYDLFKNENKAELMISLMLMTQILWLVGTHIRYFPAIQVHHFMAYLFYFGVGIYTCDHFEQLKKNSDRQRLTPFFLTTSLALTIGSSFLIIVGLSLGYRYYDIPTYFFIGPEFVYPILRIITFLFLFNLADKLVRKRSILAKIVNKIGEYSFGMYLIHIFFNQYTITLLRNYNVDYNNWRFYPIVFAVTVIFSYLAVRLISYLPFSYYIIGHRKKENLAGARRHSY